jgi:HlyD family secretion protein
MSAVTQSAPREITADTVRRSIDRHLIVGGLGSVGLAAGLVVLAALVDFSGAVVAPGRLVVASSVKQVQAAVGGTVTEIRVHDGDHVQPGDVLVKLDATSATANLSSITHASDAVRVQQARLEAEASGAASVVFPPDLMARAAEPDLSSLMAVETAEFASRRADRESQKSQLGRKIAELEQQLAGIDAQRNAVKQQLTLTQSDLESYRTLQAEGLMSNSQVNALERFVSQYNGQLGQLAGSVGEIGGEIAEANLQIAQVDAQVKSAAAHDLNDDRAKLADLTQREIAARNDLRQFEVRATQAGTVYELALHTVGGVVGPGQPIMSIVPTNDVLEVEARIDPGRVDQIHEGSEARIKFFTLGARTTPELVGVIESVSPDVIVDDRTGGAYFAARIKLPPQASADVGKSLVPGLPVEVFAATGDRSALSYLLRPLTDQIAHMFRER